jgi:hypothetical protein
VSDGGYSKDEVDAILARAVELQGHGETTSHAELVATAREIGVAPDTLEKAAAEVMGRRRDDQTLRRVRVRQWRGFYAHLLPFVSVGILLAFLNVLTGGFPWALIPMLGWGVGLASHLLAVALPDEENLQAEVEAARRRTREKRLHPAVRVSAEPFTPTEDEDEDENGAAVENIARRG